MYKIKRWDLDCSPPIAFFSFVLRWQKKVNSDRLYLWYGIFKGICCCTTAATVRSRPVFFFFPIKKWDHDMTIFFFFSNIMSRFNSFYVFFFFVQRVFARWASTETKAEFRVCCFMFWDEIKWGFPMSFWLLIRPWPIPFPSTNRDHGLRARQLIGEPE